LLRRVVKKKLPRSENGRGTGISTPDAGAFRRRHTFPPFPSARNQGLGEGEEGRGGGGEGTHLLPALAWLHSRWLSPVLDIRAPLMTWTPFRGLAHTTRLPSSCHPLPRPVHPTLSPYSFLEAAYFHASLSRIFLYLPFLFNSSSFRRFLLCLHYHLPFRIPNLPFPSP
jgi:hypothetical protein